MILRQVLKKDWLIDIDSYATIKNKGGILQEISDTLLTSYEKN